MLSVVKVKLVEELEPVGFGLATVHTEHERELARKVGVKELPHLVLLTDGKVTHYRESMLSVVKVLEFIRRKLPYKLVQRINDDNVGEFLHGWMDNRVRVLIFGKLDIVRLRYLTSGFKFRERAAIGYVQVTAAGTTKTVDRFQVDVKQDTLLLFQEDSQEPVARLAMTDLPTNTILSVIEQHQFLQLPRLSSQKVFDALCPEESSKTRKRLCVVLFTRASEECLRKVMVLWRRGEGSVKFEWLHNKWEKGPGNSSTDELRETLQRLLSANEVLSGEAVVDHLVDEHATTIFARIASR